MSTANNVLNALHSYDLKRDKPGHYRSNSPLRPGSNSHAFTLTIEDDEHGAWYDHVSHESGTLYQLAEILGVELPKIESQHIHKVPDSKRAYASIDDYAKAHGITADVLRAAGWNETIHFNRPALSFVTKNGTRYRFLDGNKPYYINPKGYKSCWYGLNATSMKRIAEGGAFTLCNGEISTVVAQHYGLPAACITGGEKGMNSEYIQQLRTWLGEELSKDVVIYVAFDCDKPGRKASALVTRQLRDAGFAAASIDLQLSQGGDMADFCRLHEMDTEKAISTAPRLEVKEPQDDPQRVNSSSRWRIMHASELKNLKPVSWLVEGEIPEGGITVLFGASGTGKSFLALDYALKIAQTDPVMYIAAEGEYGYRQRIEAWKQHHQRTEGNLYLTIGAVSFLDSQEFQGFLEANLAIKPKLVIVDTLARSMVGSDENSTRDMGLFIQAVEDLKRALNTTIMIVHHTSKTGYIERGSSSLRGAADSMIKLSDEDDHIRMECSKSKDSRPFEPRSFRLLPVTVSINGLPAESAVLKLADKVIQTTEDRLTNNQQKILEALSLEVFEGGADSGELAEITEIPRKSVWRGLSALQRLGYVNQHKKRSPYFLTEAGKDTLRRLRRSGQGILQTSTRSSFVNLGDATDATDATDASKATNEGTQASLLPDKNADHYDYE